MNMTAAEALNKKLGAGADMTLALLYYDDSVALVLDYIGRNELPARLQSVAVELAVVAYNRRGTEGEASRSEGGVSLSYIDGLPAHLAARLKNYPRKIGAISDETD